MIWSLGQRDSLIYKLMGEHKDLMSGTFLLNWVTSLHAQVKFFETINVKLYEVSFLQSNKIRLTNVNFTYPFNIPERVTYNMTKLQHFFYQFSIWKSSELSQQYLLLSPLPWWNVKLSLTYFEVATTKALQAIFTALPFSHPYIPL